LFFPTVGFTHGYSRYVPLGTANDGTRA